MRVIIEVQDAEPHDKAALELHKEQAAEVTEVPEEVEVQETPV